MELWRLVAGQCDQVEIRMVAAEASDRAHAVQAWHVQVDHDRIRRKLVGALERFDSIRRLSDDDQSWALLDQSAKRSEECGLVIRE